MDADYVLTYEPIESLKSISDPATAQALDRYLVDPDLAKPMREHARQFTLANYTWGKIAIDLI